MVCFTAKDPFPLSFPDLGTTKLQSIRLITFEDGPLVIVYAWVLYCAPYFSLLLLSLISSLEMMMVMVMLITMMIVMEYKFCSLNF